MNQAPRLLLINPWIYDFAAYDLWSKPLGLLYVAGDLRSLGYNIDFIDCLDKNDPLLLERQKRHRAKIKKNGTGPFHREVVSKPELFDFIPRHFARYGLPEDLFLKRLRSMQKPDAVLLTSFMTYWYLGPQRVTELVRQVFPGVPVILGGIYATLLPEHARNSIRPDYIVEGPGEFSAATILSEILPETPKPQLPLALDDLPWPAFDLYSRLDYLVAMTSRGCPYHCSFCATSDVSGAFRQRKPEKVAEEILSQAGRFKLKNIVFYDDALLVNKKKRLLPMLRILLNQGKSFHFHTPNGLHSREIDGETADLFYHSGFKTIRLSFESASPRMLPAMSNKVTPEDLSRAVQALAEAGYKRKNLEAYVMMGLPGQSLTEIYESILFVNSLGIKVRLASYSPIPGTPDFRQALLRGLFPQDADPLLANKTIYPLYRSREAYEIFRQVRQFTEILNQGAEREISLLNISSLRQALRNKLSDPVLQSYETPLFDSHENKIDFIQ
ncbi:MAG: radical SAM protein [Calditrichia bacterium]